MLQTVMHRAVPMYRRAQATGWVAIDLALGVHTTQRTHKAEWPPLQLGTRPFG